MFVRHDTTNLWSIGLKNYDIEKKEKEKKRKKTYLFLRYGRPVLLFTPTQYPFGKSQGFPLFGDFLLKK